MRGCSTLASPLVRLRRDPSSAGLRPPPSPAGGEGRSPLALARLAGGVAGVARGLLLFLGQLLALLAGGALGGVHLFLGGHFGGQAGGFLLGLLAAHFGLGQFVLLADGLLLGGALFGQFLELGILNRRFRLEPGQEGLFGVFLCGQAVVEAGVLEVAHAGRRVSLIGNGDGERGRSPRRRPWIGPGGASRRARPGGRPKPNFAAKSSSTAQFHWI